ncbi:metallo-dependent hydrolase [Clostridia bacterium]|nr:metallo-dependent hydrolase [Clostridia bacterium]
MYELIIKNGRILDAQNGIDRVCDLAIEKGLMKGVGDFAGQEAKRVIDATGCIVSPGLIDSHLHIRPFTQIGVPAETFCFTSGVTTLIEPGSLGPGNYDAQRWYLNQVPLRIKPMLSVTSLGLLYSPGCEENLNPEFFNQDKIEQLVNKYRDEIVSLKIRLDKGRSAKANCTNEPLSEALKLAERLGMRLCVHSTDPPTTMEDIWNNLRDGDIITHIFHNKGDTLLDQNGEVKKSAWEARARGVLFDCSSGSIHHSFKTSRPALAEGFFPDTIGTDGSNITAFVNPRVFNYLRVLSRFMALGMTVEQVLACATANAARQLRLEDKIGCFTPGSFADVAVLKLLDKEIAYEDADGETIRGKQALKCVLTVIDGEVQYRDDEI